MNTLYLYKFNIYIKYIYTMLTNDEKNDFINKLIADQTHLTSKIAITPDGAERKNILKNIQQYNRIVSMLYDLKN